MILLASVVGAAEVESARVRHAGEVQSHWSVGPFFEYRRATLSEGGAPSSFWAFRPFYSQVVDPPTETTVRDVVWPLGTYHAHKGASWWRALIAFGDHRAEDPSFSFDIFPFWFCGTDRRGEDYWGLFPIYGHHPHVLLMDDWRFVLWPIWHSYTVKGVESQAVCWPFVTWRAAPREGVGVWPFYGVGRQRESRHGYVLWPLVTWASYEEDRDTGGAGYSWMAWPFTGLVRRVREEQFLMLPPFFSYAQTPYARRWRLPWPLVDVELTTRRERVSVWPFWEGIDGFSLAQETGKKGTCEERTWRVGWKLVEKTDLETPRTRERRVSVFPFFTWDRTWSRKDAAEPSSSFLRLWPFYAQHTEKGLTQCQVLELNPIRHAEGIERNWTPFWTLWRYEEKADGRTRHAALFNFIWWHTGEKKTKEQEPMGPKARD